MKAAHFLVILALAPLLAAPAVGDIYVESPPDHAYVLVMSGTGFNGASYPDTPLLEAAVGDHVQVTILVPPTAEAHTFHMHGHPWFVPTLDRMVDTFLVQPGDLHSFTVTAGGIDREAGDWMYHCHVEEHIAGGMWGIFRVYPYKAIVYAPGPAMSVRLDRMGEPIDGATLSLTLDGAPLAAHVVPQGNGLYLVHSDLAPTAKGVLVVHATAPAGESVTRVGLGGADVPTPTVRSESVVPLAAGPLGHAHS